MITSAALPATGYHARGYGPLIGVHPLMQRVYEEIERVATAAIPVVVTGPTGAGKELVARALHAGSGRPGPFHALNVHAVAESLVESLLFGVVKGAYTGATEPRPGLIAAANRGTLLLDEAGELAPAVQAKFLRVLETSRVRRVGAELEVDVDFRLVLCIQESLPGLAMRGAWRPDFAYRVSGWVIELPPLAQRASDIPMLARHILASRREAVEWDEVVEVLQRHTWPGNVRELQRILGCADLLANGVELGARHVTEALERIGLRSPRSRVAADAEWNRSLDEVSRDHVRRVLEVTAFDITAASVILGVGRSTLFRRVREWKLRQVTRRVPIRDSSPGSVLDGSRPSSPTS